MNALRLSRLVLYFGLLVITLLLFSHGPTSFIGIPILAQQNNPSPSDPQVITTRNMNVRSTPSTGATVLTVAQPGQRFAVTGRTADGLWWRIDYNGQAAWLYASLVQATNTANVPVVDVNAGVSLRPTAAPATATAQSGVSTSAGSTSATAYISQTINVRSGPGAKFGIVASAQSGEQYAITGKDIAGAWWRINYKGQTAWLYAKLVRAENTANVAVVNAPLVPSPSAPATGAATQAGKVRLETVFSNLKQPTFVTNAGDGSGRFFVLERVGRIHVYADPNTDGQTFLDIADRVGTAGAEQGLLGLAFPPNFRTTGYFFINYTNKDGDTVIARYKVSDDPNRANRDSEFVVLFLDQPAPNHNGGMLAFGPDGYLWIGVGDGGGANDTFHNGQNFGTLFASILRLDVTSDPTVPYRIPANNPWVGTTAQAQGTRAELWAKGLRNPWRFSFDRRTNDLWIGDVGQDQYEEIDYVPAQQVRQGGLNFGWPILEGNHCLDATPCPAVSTPPLVDYIHVGNGCSVTGGYVYRGRAFSEWNGIYFFADFCSGNIWSYVRAAGNNQLTLVLPHAAAISSFGEDEAGELYITDFGGGVVYRLVAG
ncbi:MAG: PQQ-dependent sugar dehydrogenase [Caldilineaceae bacterium]